MKMLPISGGSTGIKLRSGKTLDSKLNSVNSESFKSTLGFDVGPIKLRSGNSLCNKKDHSVKKSVKTKSGQSG